MRLRACSAVVAIAGLTCLGPGGVDASTSAKTTRLSVRSSGAQVTGDSSTYGRSISKTGRFVVLESGAELVPGDSNPGYDIYLRDRLKKKTHLISIRSDETQPVTGSSFAPEISADGRFVVFEGSAQLSNQDTNATFDVYVRDRRLGKTRLANLDSAGNYDPDGDSYDPSISPNGRYVAFISESDALVENDTNSLADVFVRDRSTGETTRASISSAGVEADGVSSGPSLADNGKVTFTSNASNLVGADGNGAQDVFMHNPTGRTRRVSVRSSGSEGAYGSQTGSLSRTATVVSFVSSSSLSAADGNTLPDVYIHVFSTGKTVLVSVRSNGTHPTQEAHPTKGALSYDGRYVTFSSDRHLAPADTNAFEDMYRYDRKTGKTILVSKGVGGENTDSDVHEGSISGDGHWVAFDTDASNMVANDTNGNFDVFLRGPIP
jgi:Tol biopolymer transport system component